jgi:hypothetical protein
MKAAVRLCAAGAAFFAVAAFAQESGHMSHMSMPMAPDARRALDFPPPMRAHLLANMRGHFEALSGIVAALAAGEGAKAAEIARGKLGLDSPGAAACNPKTGQAKEGGDAAMMGAMMAQHMPPEMRELGFTMHEAASDFATEATKFTRGGDPQPALAKLAAVTQACAACHAAFRLP